jgi:hypothetical protein
MNELKYFAAIAVLGLCGFASTANGHAINLGTEHPANDNPTTILNLFNNRTGFDAAFCTDRLLGAFLDNQSVDRHNFNFNPFLFTFSAPPTSTNANTVDVTFTAVNPSQTVLVGFFVFTGGIFGGQLWTVSPDEQSGGTVTITAPLLPSGVPATISNIDVFCARPGGPSLPDTGSSAMLLGSAVTGLGLVRRYLNRYVGFAAGKSRWRVRNCDTAEALRSAELDRACKIRFQARFN